MCGWVNLCMHVRVEVYSTCVCVSVCVSVCMCECKCVVSACMYERKFCLNLLSSHIHEEIKDLILIFFCFQKSTCVYERKFCLNLLSSHIKK